MKKVLIILYYWPPAGGSAVQRWLRFSRYLPEFGWEPIVVVPKNARYAELDQNLEGEILENIAVIRLPILEPHNLYKKFVGLKKDEDLGAYMTMKSEPTGMVRLKSNVALWIRSNVFIPDARFLWVRPSVRYLRHYLKKHQVDVMITTGPPHSVHLIGLHLHKSLKIPWVADFRDPWTTTDLHTALKLTRYAERKHLRLESKVLRSADHVIAIGPDMKEEFLRIGAKVITIISNGYDESDFDDEDVTLDTKFSLVHLGTLPVTRNSSALWKALSNKSADDKQFASDLIINLLGSVDFKVLNDIESFGLKKNLNVTEFVPHRDGMRILKKSQVLLLLINKSNNAKGVITGKIFEYLAAGRPILLIGPLDGDAAKILNETGGGLATDFNDAGMIKKHIDYYYDMFRQNKLSVKSTSVSRYSRKSLTGKLATVLNEVSSKA
jgi:glycosyltransferase involved in cell wall biosynthesis